jgi:hypothetical protein
LSDAALLKELGEPESDDELDKDLKDLLNKAKKKQKNIDLDDDNAMMNELDDLE